ncbi:MAG: hypothetical protein AAF590_13135 [Pseudomonadota bacterium]
MGAVFVDLGHFLTKAVGLGWANRSSVLNLRNAERGQTLECPIARAL